MGKLRGWLKGWRLAGLVSLLLMAGITSVNAASNSISHSFQAAGGLRDGSIVSLDTGRQDYVVAANTGNGGRLIGIIVPNDGSILAVDASDNAGNVQVATSGSVATLVSTLNGDIKVGDQIGLSPFNGVGIKAVPGSRVIGLAQTDFNAGSQGATDLQIADKDGKTSTIKAGYAEVSIAIGTNAAVLASGNLNALQEAAKALTGRTVSTGRVAISLAVAIIALLALITLIYASIYGSIISVGRNPLAKYAIFRTLGSVLGLALMTASVAGVTIFLLLR